MSGLNMLEAGGGDHVCVCVALQAVIGADEDYVEFVCRGAAGSRIYPQPNGGGGGGGGGRR